MQRAAQVVSWTGIRQTGIGQAGNDREVARITGCGGEKGVKAKGVIVRRLTHLNPILRVVNGDFVSQVNHKANVAVRFGQYPSVDAILNRIAEICAGQIIVGNIGYEAGTQETSRTSTTSCSVLAEDVHIVARQNISQELAQAASSFQVGCTCKPARAPEAGID
jgi:hypothetical protein